MTASFAALGLPDRLVQALARLGIVEPFPVQVAAIPDGLEGHDIRGRAPTGSGKTLAFGLPVLARVERGSSRRPRALVLAPTRELAEQIRRDLAPLAAAVDRRVSAVYGGVGYGPQRSALRAGVDVLVATPGRMEDLIGQGVADLSDVGIVVVDEADRMADMGFLPAVRRILDRVHPGRQTLLFSATLDGDVAVLSRRYQSAPVTVEAESIDETDVQATHHFFRVSQHDRLEHTARLIHESGRSIVFTRTRHRADRLARQLAEAGVSAVALHGGRSQNQRARALKAFSSGRAQALVATDLAARGIHVEEVASVIHYDLAGDYKGYLHRSGRTARAGAGGTVVSLVMAGQEHDVQTIQRKLDLQAPIETPRIEHLHGVSNGERPSVGRRRQHPREKDPRSGRPRASTGSPSRSIFVGNLPWATTEEELERLFAGHGIVERATIIKRSGRSKGFGFVDMSMPHATTALEALRGVRLDGRQLTIRWAR